MKTLLSIIPILFLIHGCGYKTHDTYFQVENNTKWKDKYWNTSWTKEYTIDSNNSISISGLNISATSTENKKINFENKDLQILIEYQSYNKQKCNKNDIYIKFNNKIHYPSKSKIAYHGDILPPILGCAYFYKLNPKKLKSFTIFFNSQQYKIPPVKLIKKEEERYHAVELM